jgi:hypothetical protein
LKVDLKPKHNPFKTRIDTPKVSGSSGWRAPPKLNRHLRVSRNWFDW